MKRTKAEREKLVKHVSRANDKAAVASKKKALKEARTGKRSAMKEARTACKVDREKTKESTRSAYKKTVERARAKREAARAAARSRCSAGVQKVVNEYDPKIKKVNEDLSGERKHQREIQRIEATNKEREKKRPKKSAGERLHEADQEVVQNLPPELIPVWHHFKDKVKGSKRRSRYEAFMDFLHDRPEAIEFVQRRIERDTEKNLAKEQAKYYAERGYHLRKTEPPPAPDIGDELGDIVDGAFDEVATFFDDLVDEREKAA
ncbi:MAG TPA: hypothetical protein PK156_27695 [Polyangium sp.]|nr:hypothetical protein [Polyangium sp.]